MPMVTGLPNKYHPSVHAHSGLPTSKSIMQVVKNGLKTL